MKAHFLFLYSILYVIIMISFTFYWAARFSEYMYKNGDAEIICVEVVLAIPYLFIFLLQLTVKRVHYLKALFLPVLIVMVSFLISVLLLLITNTGGTPDKSFLRILPYMAC